MARRYIIDKPHYVLAYVENGTLVLQASTLVPEDDPAFEPVHTELASKRYTAVSVRDIEDDDDYWMWSGREFVWEVLEVSAAGAEKEEVNVG